MLENLRKELNELDLLLKARQTIVFDLFNTDQLKAFFRVRDNVYYLLENLTELEKACYQNKITM